MVDMLPAEALSALRDKFGDAFSTLSKHERLILVVADTEQAITRNRAVQMTGVHPFDASQLLKKLVREGFLQSHNKTRGAYYTLTGAAPLKSDDIYGPPNMAHLEGNMTHLEGDHDTFGGEHDTFGGKHGTFGHKKSSTEQRDSQGRLLSDKLDAPVLDDLNKLTPAFREGLETCAAEARNKRKLPTELMQGIILRLCSDQYVKLSCLAELVDRKPRPLRQQYLKPLTDAKKLRLALPSTPQDKRQAYRTVEGP
jgi:ATP-dependent DNA helicase RecG